LIARELPPDEVLASWQHVQQRALDLRAAGVPGTLQDLRVRAYLDLLQERDSRPATPDPNDTGMSATAGPGENPGEGPDGTDSVGPDYTGGPQHNGHGADPDDGPGPAGSSGRGPDGSNDGSPADISGRGPGRNDSGHGPGGSSGPGGPSRSPADSPGGSGRARRAGPDAGPSFAALINITVPWSTLTGQSAAPAEVAGFG
jgi:hypothetical protein